MQYDNKIVGNGVGFILALCVTFFDVGYSKSKKHRESPKKL